MKYTKTLQLSILLAIAAVLSTGLAYAEQPVDSAQGALSAEPAGMAVQLSQGMSQRELDAFFDSEYTYWDAAVLASYWGQDLDETKARIGRKVMWGPADVAMLEQFLLDARLESLQSVDELEFYRETSYGYDDAVVLADFWGDATPFDAKLRIERNLILGNADEVEAALQLAMP